MPNPIDPDLYPALAWLFELPGRRKLELLIATCTRYDVDIVFAWRPLMIHARTELEAMVERRVREARTDIVHQMMRATLGECTSPVKTGEGGERIYVDDSGQTWQWSRITDDGVEVDCGE